MVRVRVLFGISAGLAAVALAGACSDNTVDDSSATVASAASTGGADTATVSSTGGGTSTGGTGGTGGDPAEHGRSAGAG